MISVYLLLDYLYECQIYIYECQINIYECQNALFIINVLSSIAEGQLNCL